MKDWQRRSVNFVYANFKFVLAVLAVLTEPPDKVERHLANLVRRRQEGQTLFPLQDLMQLDNYPHGAYHHRC